eukprot:4535306-Prymnesium_polylepis.1
MHPQTYSVRAITNERDSIELAHWCAVRAACGCGMAVRGPDRGLSQDPIGGRTPPGDVDPTNPEVPTALGPTLTRRE